MRPKITNIAVVGAGYMGGGIAQVFALHGYHVKIADRDHETTIQAVTRLREQSVTFEKLGLFTPGSANKIANHLTAAETIEDAVQHADYVTEAVPEQFEIKNDTLHRISTALNEHAIIGTNTSALPIETLSPAVNSPERFLGVHWMNPAPFVPGVELIPSTHTSTQTLQHAKQLIQDIGKECAIVSDSPGFVANRLQFALYREAVKMVEENIATPEEVDLVVRNTFGFRLALFGPFAIGDMAGLDVYHSSYTTLAAAYGEHFTPPDTLNKMIATGKIGLKSGGGFLNIPEEDQAKLLAYRDLAYARLSALKTELGPAPGL